VQRRHQLEQLLLVEGRDRFAASLFPLARLLVIVYGVAGQVLRRQKEEEEDEEEKEEEGEEEDEEEDAYDLCRRRGRRTS
jgi:hypothetical protein